ncbi:uncharacterized protein LOC141616980 [Silene latifolia]|uniref:uncharacterized protein LOC141616980 n=1 Tax=Silene latifolia TaxID=37657 RepID=UPI003D76C012
MASENFIQAAIPRFDGHYDHWSMLMENLLRSKEFWDVIVSGVAEPTNPGKLTDAQKSQLETKKLQDLKAKNYLFQVIDRPILETILCKDSSKDIWDAMKRKYQGNARAKRVMLQGLREDFDGLRMKKGESVDDFFSRMMAIVNKMRIHGKKKDDSIVVDKILRSLTKDYNFIVCSIEESKNLDELSIDELQNSLRVHERKLGRQDEEEQALQITTRITSLSPNDGNQSTDKSNKGSNNQGRWRGRGHQSWSNRSKLVDKSTVQCHRCCNYGHYKFECRTKLSSRGGKKSNYAETEEIPEEISLLTVFEEKEETPRNMWYLDSGCNNHMYGDKKAFSELDESYRDVVKFGDNTSINVIGKGKDKAWLWHLRYGHLSFRGLKTLVEKDMNVTPEEAWSGPRPMVDHLRVFGSIAYVHVPDKKRKKLDDKGEKCVFLGVSDQSKAYRLYNPITKRMLTRRDVVFDEENFWPWKNDSDVKQLVPVDLDGEKHVVATKSQQVVTPNANQHANPVSTLNNSGY